MNIDQYKVVYLDEGFNRYCGINCNLLSTNKAQIKILRSSYEHPSISDNKSLENIGTLGLTVLIVMGFVSLISWLQLLQIKKKLRNPIYSDIASNSSINQRKFPQISCYKCKYFEDNFYLKCAVNPSKVLRPEAWECSDYEAENKIDGH